MRSSLLFIGSCVFLTACSSSDNTDLDNDGTTSLPTSVITAPPADLVGRLSLDATFYQQYLDANGLPVVASNRVEPYALLEAQWTVNQMLTNRPDILDTIATTRTRLAIMAVDEFTTDIPEHADLAPADYWDRRARGLGATDERPAASVGEENVLQLKGDPYSQESILVHEFAHVVHLQGLAELDAGFDQRLEGLYKDAMQKGLWEGTYAAINKEEYFAEGVQSWFNTNRENDSEHNDINTREELASYDPRLEALMTEVFGDNPWRYEGPTVRQNDTQHLAGFDRENARVFSWPEHLANVDVSSGPGVDANLPALPNLLLEEDWSSITSPSTPDADSVVLAFLNRGSDTVNISWITFSGERQIFETLAQGASANTNTFSGHLWEVRTVDGAVVGQYRAGVVDSVVYID